MSVSVSGTTVTFPDSSTITSGWTGFKNRIINGAMQIDQRNAGASVAVSDGTVTYITDRFLVYEATDGSVSGQQVSDAPNGFTNSLKITVTSADSSLSAGQISLLQHRIEGYNISDFGFGTASASNITLSFWIKSSLTGTFGGSINNNAENRSWLFTYTINSANTWEYKTVTITGDTTGTWLTNNSSGIRLMWSLGSGSNYVGTSGTWDTSLKLETSGTTKLIGTNGATWQITGVQLEKGSTASSFEYRAYGQELQLCQRYYQESRTASGYGAGSTAVQISVSLVCTMRAIPSVSKTSGTFRLTDGIANYDSTSAPSSYFGNSSGGSLNQGGFSGLTSTRPLVMDGQVAQAGYTFSAEL